MSDAESVLNGTLERVGPDRWRWCNGDPAPQVRDMRPAYNFRVRNYADCSYIEVPAAALEQNPELAWVREHYERKGLNGDTEQRAHAREEAARQRGEAITREDAVYLVPVDVYDRWRENTVLGAEWDREDEEKIMEKARRLRDRP